ncbi:MAG: putative bifunctional diguanylate cyclase/phosphodiesterase [Rhodocyclaceae bacterium]
MSPSKPASAATRSSTSVTIARSASCTNSARLARALEAGEFVLHYQPKIDMRDGRIIGAEALLRWQHPERGLLSPGEFLPAIEHDAFIVDLGHWIIETALEQIETWLDAGTPLDVGINIAARQLQAPAFLAGLENALARHPAAARHLELEILESAALDDIAHTTALIERCHALGLSVALDDFGTGYSSLAYLKRLPVDAIKIDQGFVRDVLTNADSLVIVRAIIGLAQAFELELVAEGVETPAQGRLLRQLGCHYAQGYGIAQPLPADDFLHWAKHWRPPHEWWASRSGRSSALPGPLTS